MTLTIFSSIYWSAMIGIISKSLGSGKQTPPKSCHRYTYVCYNTRKECERAIFYDDIIAKS